MTSNFISTDIAGNILGGGNPNEISNSYPTKLQNHIDYINTTGDTLTGDLNLNGNKIYLDGDKQRTISYLYLGLLKAVLIKTIDGLYVTDQNSITLTKILKQTINVNQSRNVNVGDPTNEYDATNKKYVDSKLTATGSSSNFDNLTLRYLKCKYLNNTFKSTFG